jgi:hypothetical protein
VDSTPECSPEADSTPECSPEADATLECSLEADFMAVILKVAAIRMIVRHHFRMDSALQS